MRKLLKWEVGFISLAKVKPEQLHLEGYREDRNCYGMGMLFLISLPFPVLKDGLHGLMLYAYLI
jgi:hypothetical protein